MYSIFRAPRGFGRRKHGELVLEVHVDGIVTLLLDALNKRNDGFSYWGEPT